MNVKRKRALAGLIVASVALAACGNDDGDGGSATTAAPTTAASDTTAPAALSGTLVGAGASSQAAAMQGWQAGFQTLNPGVTVEYDPIGSGGGRTTFLDGGSDFAGTDSYLKDEEYERSKERCPGDLGAVNLPHYISPIAVAYNLPDLGATLQLSPLTLARIFANEIMNWNDPAIAADNPGVELPDLTVNPVHRSDESGTTANFTDYLAAAAPAVWTYGKIEAWDADGPGGGEGAPQTSGVVAAINAGVGSIGYADASQIGDLGAAAIKVGDQFVEYSPEAAAKIVDVSERVPGRSTNDFSFNLKRDTVEEGVYPIALVSYHVVCLQYETQEKVDLVKAFMTYVGSPEGQAASQESAGSAPITAEMRDQVAKVIAAISVVGSAVAPSDTIAAPAPVELEGTLVGAGASSQAAAMQGWQAGFQTLNPGVTVEYDPIGSGGGRTTFLDGGSDFAGTDSYLKDEEYERSKERCPGDLGAVNLPHYISPIAVAYNLPDLGATLQLSPLTLARIFANEIMNWNDPAIAADNPGVELPDLTVNPVHRSDESGTTANFTDYLAAAAPAVWTYGKIEAWDADGPGGGEGAPQTSGVVAAINAGVGSIGYADASQIGDLGAAAIKVGDQFVEYSPEAAAKIVDVSERVPGRSTNDFSFNLKRDTVEEGVYPIALVSYHVVCLQYETQEKVDLVKAFMTYVGSPEGQAASQESAGSAPITAEMRDQVAKVIAAITVAG